MNAPLPFRRHVAVAVVVPPPQKLGRIKRRKRNRAGLVPVAWGKPDPKLAAALRDDWIAGYTGRESMRHAVAWAVGIVAAVFTILATVTAVVPHG